MCVFVLKKSRFLTEKSQKKKCAWPVLSLLSVLLCSHLMLSVFVFYTTALIVVCAYVVGGTLNHSLQLAAHELSHTLCFGVVWMDKCLGIVANFPTGVPSAITFIKYHMEHHQWQGTDFIDTDVPCDFETKLFKGPFMKFIWCILQPFFYSLRPVIMNPKKPALWEFANTVACLAFDYLIYSNFGAKALAYLVIGTFLGLGFHPLAGHFIAEHYEFTRDQETYSYYGYLNWLMFNVGYHNEHHDFPKIAWSNLRKVREVAPEYYNNLVSYDSYFPIFYEYIFNPKIGPWSRVKRAYVSKADQKKANKAKAQ
jgi:sphingolipid delta-4 desaturase